MKTGRTNRLLSQRLRRISSVFALSGQKGGQTPWIMCPLKIRSTTGESVRPRFWAKPRHAAFLALAFDAVDVSDNFSDGFVELDRDGVADFD